MMTKIWKYELDLTDTQTLDIPVEYSTLSVGLQGGKTVLWCAVNPDAPTERCTFRIIGTGHPIPDYGVLAYIGTVQQGGLAWHIFEQWGDL